MSIPVIACFNGKKGVGKTTLVYHLSWTFADRGLRVLAADMDPQAGLTASFLGEDHLEKLWWDNPQKHTITDDLTPLVRGTGEPRLEPCPIEIDEKLFLLPGDLELACLENDFSRHWAACLEGLPRAFEVTFALRGIIQAYAREAGCGLVLMDLGPTLGALNRAALFAADYLVMPLTPDMHGLLGLRNTARALETWRKEGLKRLQLRRESAKKNPLSKSSGPEPPETGIQPLGYVVMGHTVGSDDFMKNAERWVAAIPDVYAKEISRGIPVPPAAAGQQRGDLNCIGRVKNYRSLITMTREAGKPMFHLLPADGAIGSHHHAVTDARKSFNQLAEAVETRIKG